jgi:osmotically-inducible protein OsmY
VKVVIALILGIVIGAVAFWLVSTDRGQAQFRATQQQLETATREAREAAQEQMRSWNLDPQNIKDELGRSGQVIRRKAAQAGQAIADATADARITAAIKAKLVADPDLSALSISVNTTAGVVTFSGAVASAEQISKAMLIGMQTDGVKEVVSTLQIKPRPAKQ